MTDSNGSLNEVPALLDGASPIRRVARRARCAPGDDAAARVRARAGGLSHAPAARRRAARVASHAIESERANVQSRLSLLAAEEQLRRDERAELELRTHVGELSRRGSRPRVRQRRRGDCAAGWREGRARRRASPSCRRCSTKRRAAAGGSGEQEPAPARVAEVMRSNAPAAPQSGRADGAERRSAEPVVAEAPAAALESPKPAAPRRRSRRSEAPEHRRRKREIVR